MVHEDRFEALSAAADGELDADERARLDEHLVSCADCRAQLATLEGDRRRLLVSSSPAPGVEALADRIDAERRRERLTSSRAGTTLARRAVASAVGVAAAAVVALGLGGGSSPTAPAGDEAAITIHADADDFRASEVTVPSGTTVEWHNDSGEAHQLVRRVGGVAIAQDLPPGAAETSTFAAPGTFEFYCTLHPAMAGRVTVDA